MKQLLCTTMFALVAAMGICPAQEEIPLPWKIDAPATMQKWSHEVVRKADGAHVCRIRVSVRAVEGKVPDATKFSVQAEWEESRTPHRMWKEATAWSSHVKVKMDASRLRWQKENPDWADGVESFEISFPVAIPEDRMETARGSLSVTLYYDGKTISWHGPAGWFEDCAYD